MTLRTTITLDDDVAALIVAARKDSPVRTRSLS
jgi:hypothetical protein